MSEQAPDQRVFAGPVLRTFLAYAAPSLVGLVAISTASIVDGLFVGRFVGSDALAAVNLLLPYFTLLFGLALMLAMGGSVLAGHSSGAGDRQAASAMFSKSVVAVVVLSGAAALVANTCDHGLFRLLGAPTQLLPLMREYFPVISLALIVQLGTLVVYYFVRLDGRPGLATAAVVTGALANIGLNGLLVAGLGWGLGGAAWATLLAQLLQLAVLLSHFRSTRCTLRFSLRQRHWSELGHSAYCGTSELVNEVSIGLVVLLLNWLLIGRVGVHGVAAFTVVSYVTFASLMVYYGASDALHLLVSQNLGAGNPARARAFLRCALGCVVAFGVLLASALLAAGDRWLALFVAETRPEVLEQARAFLSVMWPLLLINGVNVVITVYLAASQRPAQASLLALSRSLVMPAAFLLALAFVAPGVPFVAALPLAEAATLLLGLALLLGRRPVAPALVAGPGARATAS